MAKPNRLTVKQAAWITALEVIGLTAALQVVTNPVSFVPMLVCAGCFLIVIWLNALSAPPDPPPDPP